MGELRVRDSAFQEENGYSIALEVRRSEFWSWIFWKHWVALDKHYRPPDINLPIHQAVDHGGESI